MVRYSTEEFGRLSNITYVMRRAWASGTSYTGALRKSMLPLLVSSSYGARNFYREASKLS